MATLSCEMLRSPCPACAWVGTSHSGTTGPFVPKGTPLCRLLVSERSLVPLWDPVPVTQAPQGRSPLSGVCGQELVLSSCSGQPAPVRRGGHLMLQE